MDNNNPTDPKAQESIVERIKADKARVLEEARKTVSISGVAIKTGISRATIYRWEKEDPDFKKQLDEALLLRLEAVRDGAFVKLANYVSKGENENDWRAQLSLIKYADARISRLTKDQSADANDDLESQTVEAIGELLIAASKRVKGAE